MKYTFRTDTQQRALESLPDSQFISVDKPFLYTQRYSITGGFEPFQLEDKEMVDEQGTQDNQYWYQRTIEQKMKG